MWFIICSASACYTYVDVKVLNRIYIYIYNLVLAMFMVNSENDGPQVYTGQTWVHVLQYYDQAQAQPDYNTIRGPGFGVLGTLGDDMWNKMGRNLNFHPFPTHFFFHMLSPGVQDTIMDAKSWTEHLLRVVYKSHLMTASILFIFGLYGPRDEPMSLTSEFPSRCTWAKSHKWALNFVCYGSTMGLIICSIIVFF